MPRRKPQLRRNRFTPSRGSFFATIPLPLGEIPPSPKRFPSSRRDSPVIPLRSVCPERETQNATNRLIGRHRKSKNVAQSSYLSQIGSFRTVKCRPIGLFVAKRPLRLGRQAAGNPGAPGGSASQRQPSQLLRPSSAKGRGSGHRGRRAPGTPRRTATRCPDRSCRRARPRRRHRPRWPGRPPPHQRSPRG